MGEEVRGYLVEIPGEKREAEAVRRLISMPFLSDELLGALGLASGFSWYVLQLQMKRLVEDLEGDVDILAGRLCWDDPASFDNLVREEQKEKPGFHPSWHDWFAARRLSTAGGIHWPPPTDFLVGIEAKCAYFTGSIKAAKSSNRKVRRIRLEVQRLLRLGCNRVALLDIIANPPASGIDGQAWLMASDVALASFELMQDVLAHRLPEEAPVGHWVWPVGAVVGGDETVRGAGAPLRLREAFDNPLLKDDPQTQRRRQEAEARLRGILGSLTPARSFPVVHIDCRSCSTIHSASVQCQR